MVGNLAPLVFQIDSRPVASNDCVADLGRGLPLRGQLVGKENLLETDGSLVGMPGRVTAEETAMPFAPAVAGLLHQDLRNLLRNRICLDGHGVVEDRRREGSRKRPPCVGGLEMGGDSRARCRLGRGRLVLNERVYAHAEPDDGDGHPD